MAEPSSPTASFSAARLSQEGSLSPTTALPPSSGLSSTNDSLPRQAAFDIPYERLDKILKSEVRLCGISMIHHLYPTHKLSLADWGEYPAGQVKTECCLGTG